MAVLHRLIIVVILSGVGMVVHAQAIPRTPDGFPQKPVRIIVSSSPGGGQDATTRPVAIKLGESLGVSVVVDNRGGASGIIAMDVTRQAAPDGYTLLVGATSMILMGVTNKVPYDLRTAFDLVVQMTSQPYLLIVHPAVPVSTPKDFIAYAKTKPGILTYGTSGPGSLHNLGMELFESRTGTKLVHILAETVAPGYELANSYSIFAPAGTPKPIVALLNRELSRIVNVGEVKEKFAADGAEPASPRSVDEFRRVYLAEVAKWEKFVRDMKVKL